MKATHSMIIAARRAEADYYQRRRTEAGRFIPTPDAIIKAMLDAALALVEPVAAPTWTRRRMASTIVEASPPRRTRR